MNSPKESGRKLRAREKRRYTEEFVDEDIEGRRMFSVEEKLNSARFETTFVKEMQGEEITLKYFQEHGFDVPLFVRSKNGLGMKIPDKTFTVNDVRQNIGNKRVLDVMDVTTQKDIEMTMKEWCKYYENTKRDRLLNVISLEFSHTKLDNLVEAPAIVRQVDWVDTVWPKHLKNAQTESTNSLEDMKYPKVQKYCLMSVKGCYTDFHIDFGGTSVWYHILRGKKVFWLIPPSERNIQLYEQWVLSGKQSDIFFGDTVEQCARITLLAGYTFFIPTGWIHAVHTPEDSLVFGGNFLHSFAIEKQLRIAQVEDITKVPAKYRYPFYNEMLWFVLQRYVYCLSGKNHLSCNEDGSALNDTATGSLASCGSNFGKPLNVHLTPFELNGLNATVMWLSRLSNSKRSVPSLITNPEALLNDAKLLIDEHSTDDARVACSGRPVLFWSATKSKPLATTLTNVSNSSSNTPMTTCNTTSSSSTSTSSTTTTVNGTQLSVTAQLRQIKHTSFSSALKQNALKLSQNSIGETEQVKRPESPPTRPLSSSQYQVNMKKTSFDQIPSSFADLIAATDVNNQNRLLLKSSPLSSTTSSSMTGDIVSSVITKETINPVNKTIVNGVAINTLNGKTNGNNSAANANDNSRRRRTRCKRCDSCLRADCGECHFCKDMKKFGGPGRMKQSCIARQCSAPVLPHTACCVLCGRDGWEKVVTELICDEAQSSLMECSKCWEIAHPVCIKEKLPSLTVDGTVSDELPNSWECPKCVAGFSIPLQPNVGITSLAVVATKRPPSSVVSGNVNGKPQIFNGIISSSKLTSANCKPETETPVKKARYNTVIDDHELYSEENSSCSNSSGEDCKYMSAGNSNATSNNASNVSSVASSLKPPNTSTSHVRSCARFPLLQEAIKQQQQESKCVSSTKAVKLVSEPKVAVKIRKQHESSRERLFRSLKGLKKSSELLRFSNAGSKKIFERRSHSGVNDSGCISGSSGSTSGGSTCGTVSPLFERQRNESHNGSDIEKEEDDESIMFDAETDNENDENDSGKTIITNSTMNPNCPKTPIVKFEQNPQRKFQSSPLSSDEDEDDMLIEANLKSKRPTTPNKKKDPDQTNPILKKPLYVVRPAPLPGDVSDTDEDADDDDEEDEAEDSDEDDEQQTRTRTIKKHLKHLRKKRNENLSLEKDVIVPILPYLCRSDLINCMKVCKRWNVWCMDPKLWRCLDLTRKRITAANLIGIVRRQPIELKLSWCNLTKKQLSWLLARLPRLQALYLNGCQSSVLSSLSSCNCALLKLLDLSWMNGLNDNLIRELLATPSDSRPGLMETKTRLRFVTDLRLAGSDVSDLSIRLIANNLPLLTSVDLSNCHKITDMGIAVLSTKCSKLISLKLSSCANITDTSLESLKRCTQLRLLDVRDCVQVKLTACQKLINSMNAVNKLIMKQPKLLEAKGNLS